MSELVTLSSESSDGFTDSKIFWLREPTAGLLIEAVTSCCIRFGFVLALVSIEAASVFHAAELFFFDCGHALFTYE